MLLRNERKYTTFSLEENSPALHILQVIMLLFLYSLFESMKKILLVGKQLTEVPPGLNIKNVQYFAAPDLDTAQQVFERNDNAIDIVIMGAGIELEKRLEVARYVFNSSNTTTVHMKDPETGPQGFAPFINSVLSGLLRGNE